VIVTNLSGWKRPAEISASHAGEFADVAWARCQVDAPYPEGGWHLPIEGRDIMWQIVAVSVNPQVVAEEDGSLILLTWNGSASDPRITGVDLSSGEYLTEGYRIGPAPIVNVAVTSHTGVAG
jgi:hypothetical protein